jgi:hypothetical protein
MSLRGLSSSRLGEAAVPTTRFVFQAATVGGSVGGWRVDRARPPLGRCRQRVSIQGRRCSGCVPGRCGFNDGFNPPMVSGVLCDSFQSLLAMGLLQFWVVSVLPGAGDGRQRRLSTRLQCTVARVLLVFSDFF